MSSQSSRPTPGGVALSRVKYMTGSRHRACFFLRKRDLYKQTGGREHHCCNRVQYR